MLTSSGSAPEPGWLAGRMAGSLVPGTVPGHPTVGPAPGTRSTLLPARLRGASEPLRLARERAPDGAPPRPRLPRGRARLSGPLVGPDRQRREHDEDDGQRDQALPPVGIERPAQRQRAHLVDHPGDRLVVSEGLQPA